MVSKNKILTVSYGTFSCTLEGFDDPVSTLQALAEYFRDLAANDPHFGAEPPIPDTDALHHFAQGQTMERVQARFEGDRVVLRPDEAAGDAATVEQPTLLEGESPPQSDEPHSPDTAPDQIAPHQGARAADIAPADHHTAPPRPEGDVPPHDSADILEDLDVASFFDATSEQTTDHGFSGHTAHNTAVKDHTAARATSPLDGPLLLTPKDSTLPVTDEDVDAILSQLNSQGETGGYDDDTDESTQPEQSIHDAIDTTSQRPLGRVVRVKRSQRDQNRTTAHIIQNRADIDDATIIDEHRPEIKAPKQDDAPDGAEKLRDLIDHEIKTEARRERREQVFEQGAADQSEDTLKRMLDETNDQMKSREASRRRRAISHMKAAVQARRADDKHMPRPADSSSHQAAFKEDLNRAVSPKRPLGPKQQSQRFRLAPLILVSEQRVDIPDQNTANRTAEQTDQAVRPRRVVRRSGTKAETLASTDVMRSTLSSDPDLDGFAAYVSGADASDMTGLMASAAKYATKVQGLSHFSRPHLMRLVIGLNVNGGISRQEALNAFGRLLRDERIRKVAPGLFTLGDTEDSGLQTA